MKPFDLILLNLRPLMTGLYWSLYADLLLHLGRVVGGICRTVQQDCFVDVMPTGNSQPEADRKGIDFRVHMQIPWNAPEPFVTLGSPGCLCWTLHMFRTSWDWDWELGTLMSYRWKLWRVEPRKVFGSWSRTRKGRIADFMMSRSSTWLMWTCLLYMWWTCVSYGVSCLFRWCTVCSGNRRTLSRCVRSVSGVFEGPEQGVARFVEWSSKMTWHAMSPAFISIWPSCGGAWWRGASSGRSLHMTVWII